MLIEGMAVFIVFGFMNQFMLSGACAVEQRYEDSLRHAENLFEESREFSIGEENESRSFEGAPGDEGPALVADFLATSKEIDAALIDTKKVPLGKSASLSKYVIGKVYVPTKWGGELKLSGSSLQLFYSDGSDLDRNKVKSIFKGDYDSNIVASGSPCQYTVPENKPGWYYIKTPSESLVSISSEFKQEGSASPRPFNFYWWATKGDYINDGGNGVADTTAAGDDVQVVPPGSPAGGGDIIRCGNDGIMQSVPGGDDRSHTMINLFDVPGPLSKYDAVFGTTARDWEAQNGQGLYGWEGHCLGGAMASVLLDQPSPTGSSGMNNDELEGLWAEMGETTGIYTVPDYMGGCPAGPPTSGSDSTDSYVGNFHRMLEQYIKGSQVSLQSNLRSEGSDPGEVWNHAVWRFEAQYEEAPGDDEKIVRIENDVDANQDHTPPTDDTDDRSMTYTYIVEYQSNGEVSQSSSENDWISVAGHANFAPSNMLRVTDANWGGNNPHVTEGNVRSIDTAN